MKMPNIRQSFLYVLIGSIALSAAIGIVIILIGKFGEFETKVLLTTLTITVTSILGLACGAYLEPGRAKLLPSVGIALALASAVMWLVIIWYGTIHNDWFVKSLMSATLIAASCSHLSLLSIARLEKKFIWSLYAAHVAVWSLTAFLLYFIWSNGEIDEDLMGRVTGVLGIIIGSLTVVTPIFHRLSSGEPNLGEIDDEIAKLRSRIEELERQRTNLLGDPTDGDLVDE